jgi:hypothetical protein
VRDYRKRKDTNILGKEKEEDGGDGEELCGYGFDGEGGLWGNI